MDFITSNQMYNDALKLFHIEICQVQKGHLVFVTDGNGNPVRHPIKMPDLDAKPRFYLTNGKGEGIEPIYGDPMDKSYNKIKNLHGNSRILIDLLRLIPNYSNKNSFRREKQMIKKRRRGQERL